MRWSDEVAALGLERCEQIRIDLIRVGDAHTVAARRAVSSQPVREPLAGNSFGTAVQECGSSAFLVVKT